MALSRLHWVIGASVVGCVATVKLSQWSDKDDKERKGRLMHLHKSLALVVAALVPVRIGVRLASRMPAHLPGTRVEQLGGSLSHLALYGLTIGLPASGIAMGYFSGYGLPFFWTKIDGASTPNKAISGAAYKAHSLMGQVLTYLIPLHVGASLVHVYKGHRIFGRINPFV